MFRETPETSEQGLQGQTTGIQTVAPQVSIYEAFYTLQRFPETWFILCESGEWIPVLLSLQVPVVILAERRSSRTLWDSLGTWALILQAHTLVLLHTTSLSF